MGTSSSIINIIKDIININVVKSTLTVLKDLLTLAGILATLLWLRELYRKNRTWKRQLRAHTELLQRSDYFIAHIIHLGGAFSTIHSMQVYSDEEGGFYFNPPDDFVSLSFNRGGDLMAVMPSRLSNKFGFVIDSVAGTDLKFNKHHNLYICHLECLSIKNEYYIKFIKMRK